MGWRGGGARADCGVHRVGRDCGRDGGVLSHQLDTVIHKETLEEMLSLLNGHQLLVLYLVLYCSDNYCHAADQLGCRKQTICKHIYNIRALWLEHIPELAEAAAGREAQKHEKRKGQP